MPFEPIKLLLVEDNLGDARLLYEGLQETLPEQFRITHARRLSEALEYLWAETCDVVLLDLGLPDSHGLDTLLLMRAQAPAVPIVVLTGFQDEALAMEALKAGAQDYLVKGQSDSTLLARSMRYAIARKTTEEALLQRGVACATADDMLRSRQRIIALQERVRRDIAGRLQYGVQKKLLELKDRLQELVTLHNPTAETFRLLSEAVDGLRLVIEQDVDALQRQLYPLILSRGFVPAFQSLRERFECAPAIEIEMSEGFMKQEQADGHPVPEQAGLAAYRIAEEALTNAVEHARAGRVTVQLDRPQTDGEDWLRLTVFDDGQGFDMGTTARGLGMATMQDYAEAVGGECLVHSTPDRGTKVTAILPLVRPGAADTAGTLEREEATDGKAT